MKTLTPEMEDALLDRATTLATCWKVTRTDGVVMGFTNVDKDLTVDGVLYKSAPSFEASAIRTAIGLGTDNLTVQGFMNDDEITEEDLLAGRYDYAEVEIFVVDYNSPDNGKVEIVRGLLSETSMTDNTFNATLRSLTTSLHVNSGEVSQPGCRYVLGDDRCTVDLTGFSASGTVASVTNRRIFQSDVVGAAENFLKFGVLTWTSGNNDTFKVEVKANNAGLIELILPAPYNIQIGDTFTVHAGCDKRLTTCRNKFNNAINFGGEPHLPGIDEILNPLL